MAAKSKTTAFMASLLLLALLLGSAESVYENLAESSPPAPGSNFCDTRCAVRCSKASVHDRCMKYCGICCEECDCVPSGTYGHKEECPCYAEKKNSKGKPKCP